MAVSSWTYDYKSVRTTYCGYDYKSSQIKKASEVDEDDDDSQEIPKIPISNAIQMLQSIEIFLIQQDGDHKDQVKMVQKILDDVKVIRQSNLKQ
ncbi:hypothetical protein OROGR_003147 [Orobanche gracilis]